MYRFTLKDFEKCDVIRQGHFDNLMYEDEDARVWLSRCTVEDGEPYNNKVTVERLVNGKWVITDTYEAV